MSHRPHSDDQTTDPNRQKPSLRRNSSERAAAQLDRLVEHEQETEQLVSELGEPDEPGSSAADSGRAQLRAMTAPPHDAGQVDEMTDAAARMRTTARPRPRQPWWRRVVGWLPSDR